MFFKPSHPPFMKLLSVTFLAGLSRACPCALRWH